jgi:hypothetical protein
LIILSPTRPRGEVRDCGSRGWVDDDQATRLSTILHQGIPLSRSIVTLSDRPDLVTTVATWVHEQWWRHLPEHSAETLANMLRERRASDHI